MLCIEMEDSTNARELEHLSQVADAKLGVAEELGWAVAILAAAVVHLKWESWLLTICSAIGSYVLAVYRYRKRAADAEDNYFRAAGLGKYVSKREGSNV